VNSTSTQTTMATTGAFPRDDVDRGAGGEEPPRRVLFAWGEAQFVCVNARPSGSSSQARLRCRGTPSWWPPQRRQGRTHPHAYADPDRLRGWLLTFARSWLLEAVALRQPPAEQAVDNAIDHEHAGVRLVIGLPTLSCWHAF
jgi:hypothetical protein